MDQETRLRAHLWRIAQSALQAVEPQECIRRTLRREGERLLTEGQAVDLSRIQRIIVVGLGKASARMAAALEAILSDRITTGLVVIADGYNVPTTIVEVVEAGHPIPDERGLAAAKRITALIDGAGEEDLVTVLISGGGSALFTLPSARIRLTDLMRTNQQLLRSSAKIQEFNTVRKHLS